MPRSSPALHLGHRQAGRPGAFGDRTAAVEDQPALGAVVGQAALEGGEGGGIPYSYEYVRRLLINNLRFPSIARKMGLSKALRLTIHGFTVNSKGTAGTIQLALKFGGTVWVGLGGRTNEAGLHQLRDHVGVRAGIFERQARDEVCLIVEDLAPATIDDQFTIDDHGSLYGTLAGKAERCRALGRCQQQQQAMESALFR